ncbi:MAG: hypothetical protein NVS1B7_1920 [Candidatus Saccharimonadales bacterium]
MERQLFTKIRQYNIDTSIFEPREQSKGKILFLHGAGESTKDRCAPLAQALVGRGYRCLTFSMPGHGASSGSLQGSSLQEREDVAHEVAQYHGYWPVDMIVAVSMGAHTAMSLLARNVNACKRLVLMVPATYSQQAQAVPFGPLFSAIIRNPNSYQNSQAAKILAKYRGELAIIRAGQDTIIPDAIYDLLHQHVPVGKKVHTVCFQESAHQVTKWLAAKEHRIEAMAQALDHFNFEHLARLS